jgi:prevent-host-death family protein
MKIAPLADVKARLTAYIDECEAGGPVIITRNGKPVAVLLAPQDDDDLERLILGHSRRFQAILENSWNKIKEGKRLSSEAFWRAVEKQSSKKPPKRKSQAATDTGAGKK